MRRVPRSHNTSSLERPPTFLAIRVSVCFFDYNFWDLIVPVDKYPFESSTIRLWNRVLMGGKFNPFEDIHFTIFLRRTEPSGLLDPILYLNARNDPRTS